MRYELRRVAALHWPAVGTPVMQISASSPFYHVLAGTSVSEVRHKTLDGKT